VAGREVTSTVVWFRRDLRTDDHPALRAAVDDAAGRGGAVAPLFVADGPLLEGAGANRRAFLAGCLRALSAEVEGELILRHGPVASSVSALAAEVGARTVVATGDCTPYGRRRDAAVAEALAAEGRTLVLVGSPYAVAPGRVRSGTGAPYRVFTPFRRGWDEHGWAAPTAPPAGVRWRTAEASVTVDEIGAEPTSPGLPDPGAGAARAVLDRFLDGPADEYGTERDRPDHRGTSHLSPHLRFGTLHPRRILSRLGRSDAHRVFRSELAWREFYADVLWHHPGSAWESLQPIGRYVRWDQGHEADLRFEAWATGQTGFPLVDAGMRQLRSEGWMHNRVRMLVASFLVKDLHLDWRRGARFFMEWLVDGDLASNNHGWQWVAGTGTDAAPFHRVFNPTLQAERFDPDGAYVARYVPEAGGFGYPSPIVDHATERVEALARWEEAKQALAAGSAEPAGTGKAGGGR
jgi:deoxyribodipyrimidine photo-lyase